MSFLITLLAITGTLASSAWAGALAVLELPSKFPGILGSAMFIALISVFWETIYTIFGLLGVDLNIFGIPLNGITVSMVVVTGMVVNHFLFDK